MQSHAMIHSRTFRAIQRQYVVILHTKVIAVIVKWDTRFNIMGRVNINATVKYMSRRVGCVDVFHQRLGNSFGL